MKNAADNAVNADDDEQGVAAGAASLGADGGPALEGGESEGGFEAGYDDLADDSWLDEELSDEELAALGEEDFSDEDFADAEFSEEELAAAGLLDEDSEDSDTTFEDDLGIAEAVMDELSVAPTSERIEEGFSSEAEEPELVAPSSAEFSDEDAYSVEDEALDTSGALVAASGGALAGDALGGEVGDFGDDEVDHRPVPRISIHAFCETPQTTALLEKAAVDRRLSKAHLTMHMGGVAKAIEQFQHAATPNLIILETLANGAEIFAQLGELAEVCDPSTKVVIIGQVNDIILYRELIRQGISEYIVRPNSPLQIIKTIADLYVDPSAPPIGRTIAFVGARGGVGSSTLAHNVAWCTAEEFDSDTVILDLDLPFGTASLDFDQEASAGLAEALASPERLDDVLLERLLQKHTDHLSLFTAPSVLDREYDMDDQAFETVIDVVRGSAPTIIVDVPHVWTSWSKRILTTADEIVIVATPDLAAFRNTKNMIDLLSAGRPNDSAPILVINQFDSKLSAVQPDQYEEHVGAKAAQVFSWEPQLFGTAATNAAPIVEISPKSKTAHSVRELAAQIIGRNDAQIARPKFSLSGLFSKKR